MKRNPQQGAGADNLILRRVLVKIFERRKCLGHLLHLVKNEQGIVRVDFLPGIQLQAGDNSLY